MKYERSARTSRYHLAEKGIPVKSNRRSLPASKQDISTPSGRTLSFFSSLSGSFLTRASICSRFSRNRAESTSSHVYTARLEFFSEDHFQIRSRNFERRKRQSIGNANTDFYCFSFSPPLPLPTFLPIRHPLISSLLKSCRNLDRISVTHDVDV